MEAKIELILHLKELPENEDVFQAKRELKHIYELFDQAKAKGIDEQRQQFLDSLEELSEEEKAHKHFEAIADQYDEEFEKTYREIRFILKEREEKKRNHQKDIYVAKLAIIDRINDIAHEENIAKAFKTFNELKDEWKSAGLSSRVHEKELHDKHNAVVKEFYYNMNIYKELKAYDFDRNLKSRREIIEACKEVMEIKSIQNKRDKFYKLQQKWYDAGPVSREDYDVLHDEWKEINEHFHEQLGEYYDKLHTEQDDNLVSKLALVKEVEEIDTQLIDSHSKWQKITKKVIGIQAKWKTIGFARRKENEAVWKAFRAVCDEFFKNKQVFYNQLKGEQDLNKEKKQQLIDRAIELKESTDWKKTTQDFIRIQRDWKEIAPAHHMDEKKLWLAFRKNCNEFFDKKKSHFAEQDVELHENLKLKNIILEELEAFKPVDDKKETINALKEYSKRWNEIGHVPYREKNAITKKYQDILNKQYTGIKLDEDEKIKILFQNKIDQLKGASDPVDALYNEKSFLKEKVDKLHSDLIQFENNMGFINSKDNSLLNRLQKSVDNTQHEIDQLEAKIKLINISIHRLEKDG
jgi:hypothetical protein